MNNLVKQALMQKIASMDVHNRFRQAIDDGLAKKMGGRRHPYPHNFADRSKYSQALHSFNSESQKHIGSVVDEVTKANPEFDHYMNNQ